MKDKLKINHKLLKVKLEEERKKFHNNLHKRKMILIKLKKWKKKNHIKNRNLLMNFLDQEMKINLNKKNNNKNKKQSIMLNILHQEALIAMLRKIIKNHRKWKNNKIDIKNQEKKKNNLNNKHKDKYVFHYFRSYMIITNKQNKMQMIQTNSQQNLNPNLHKNKKVQ